MNSVSDLQYSSRQQLGSRGLPGVSARALHPKSLLECCARDICLELLATFFCCPVYDQAQSRLCSKHVLRVVVSIELDMASECMQVADCGCA